MSDEVTLDGLDDVLRALDQLPQEVATELKAAMERGAERIVNTMRRLCPVLKGPHAERRAGALRDSIGWTWGEPPAGTMAIGKVQSDQQALVITFYAGNKEAFYARFVEFGTQRHSLAKNASVKRGLRQSEGIQHPGMEAHPFFYVSWKMNKRGFYSAEKRAITKAAKRLFADAVT